MIVTLLLCTVVCCLGVALLEIRDLRTERKGLEIQLYELIEKEKKIYPDIDWMQNDFPTHYKLLTEVGRFCCNSSHWKKTN